MTALNNTYDVSVIGGGASGMLAAISAARYAKDCAISLRIVIFERNDRLGRKLFTTGNGRCNLTNVDQDASHYHGSDPSFALGALKRFSKDDTLAFFEELGVLTTEEDGKVFPRSLHSSAVCDALRLALTDYNIQVITNCKITDIKLCDGTFCLCDENKEEYVSKSVITATGGMCAQSTGSDGNFFPLMRKLCHGTVDMLPSIVQVKASPEFCKPLAGIKVNGTARLVTADQTIRTESGEVLFTDYGVSGPPILQLSGYISRALHTEPDGKPEIHLDYFPESSPEELMSILFMRRELFKDRSLEDYFVGLMQRRLAVTLLKSVLSQPLSSKVGDMSDTDVTQLSVKLKDTILRVTGTMPFSNAQTTIGGMSTSLFSSSSMESRKVKGLFSCGEMLDIDGDCGGYNLQWAWSSGYVAGRSAVKYCMELK